MMASLKTNANLRTSLPEGFEAPEGLVAVAAFDDYRDANDAGLAVLAMGGVYWMIYAEPVYVLCVHQARAHAVQSELEAYWALQVGKPLSSGQWPLVDISFVSFLIYGLGLCGIFLGQPWWNLVEIGRMDAVMVVERWQIWRAVTALTLHSDVVHLVSNIVGGIGFVLLVCRLFGAGLGWLLVLLSGVLGNLITAVLYYPDPHLAIGASTAVFGALGVLTASGIWMTVSAREVKLSLPQWMLPLVGGVVLLGLLGVGEGPVDVLAHLNGFLAGAVLGLGVSTLRGALIQHQLLAGSAVLLLTLLAWICSLAFASAQSALP